MASNKLRRKFSFFLDGSAEALAEIKDADIEAAIRAQMAAELTPEQKRNISVLTQAQYQGHFHNGSNCAYCEASAMYDHL